MIHSQPAVIRIHRDGSLASSLSIPLGLGGLKLLHLADLHADPMPLSFLSQQIHRALAWKPDFICVTGDFITTKFDEWDAYAAILRTLQATAPTFATLGNHDGGRWARTKGYSDTQPVRELLEHGKLTLLHNTQHDIELHGRRIKLIGLGDDWAGDLEPVKAFGGFAGIKRWFKENF